MAASNLNLGKASGGVLNVQPADGTTTTNIVLPASGTVTTNEYVNSNNLGNGSTTFNGFGGTGFKNYIINGDFSIWQRGTSFSSVGYCADRWHLSIGGSASAAKHSMYPNTILVSTTAASSFANLYQAIETATVIGLRGKTLTLSLKLGIGGTHTGGFALTARYSNSTDALNSQTTTIQSVGISASSANTGYSLTFTVPTDAVGLRIDIENTSVQPSGALYQVQEVQLEEGSVATPFEQRPYGLELSLCQRYFNQIGAGAVGFEESTTKLSFGISYPPMRTIPTATLNISTLSWRLASGVDRTGLSVSINTTTLTTFGGVIYLNDLTSGSISGRQIIARVGANWLNLSAEL